MYSLGRMILFSSLFVLIFADRAHAYLDPGTVSYILSLMIAFFIAALFTIKQFWSRMKFLFHSWFTPQKKGEDDEALS